MSSLCLGPHSLLSHPREATFLQDYKFISITRSLTSTICRPRGQLKRNIFGLEQARAVQRVYINEIPIRSGAYIFCSWKKLLDDTCRAWLTAFASTTLQHRKGVKQSYIYAATRPLTNLHHSVHCGLPCAHPCAVRGRSPRRNPYIGHMFPFLCHDVFRRVERYMAEASNS